MFIHLSLEGTVEVLSGVLLEGYESISELFRFEIDVVRGFCADGFVTAMLGKLEILTSRIRSVLLGAC